MRQLWMYLPLILACTISLRAEDPPAAEFQVWSKAAGFVCPEITVQHHSPSDKKMMSDAVGFLVDGIKRISGQQLSVRYSSDFSRESC
ncbi:MAG UNVERIFIED_CONTAM: hypothetical protein LVR18_25505 [Planctomycetaceae bacterium]